MQLPVTFSDADRLKLSIDLLQVKGAAGKVRIIAESAAIMTYICLAYGAGTGLQTSCCDDTVRVTEVCSDRIIATLHMPTELVEQAAAGSPKLLKTASVAVEGLEQQQ
jgi:hypothetical protein